MNDAKTTYPENGTGLAKKITRKDLEFVLNLTKGRIAETLVQELFLLEGFQVYKYGLESNYQGLYKQLKGNKSPSAVSLRVSPDLVVYKNETVTYLEVKFCSTKYFTPDVPRGYNIAFPNCHFVFITPEKIYAVEYCELRKIIKKNGRFTFLKHSDCLLNDNMYFNLRENTVREFETLAKKIFTNGLI